MLEKIRNFNWKLIENHINFCVVTYSILDHSLLHSQGYRFDKYFEGLYALIEIE